MGCSWWGALSPRAANLVNRLRASGRLELKKIFVPPLTEKSSWYSAVQMSCARVFTFSLKGVHP